MANADLQHAALDHNLHPVGWYTGYLVYSIFEEGRGLIWIERDIVCFSGVFDVDSEGWHCGQDASGGSDASYGNILLHWNGDVSCAANANATQDDHDHTQR
jgi:hypothetical protein